MVKMLRLLRVFKALGKNKFAHQIKRTLRISSAIQRLITGILTAILATHLFACFWFLCAKLNDLGPETWVWRVGIRDSPIST